MTEDEKAGIKAMLLHAEKYGHEEAIRWLKKQYMIKCIEFDNMPIGMALATVNKVHYLTDSDSTDEATEILKNWLDQLGG